MKKIKYYWDLFNRYSIGRNNSVRFLPTINPNSDEDYETFKKYWRPKR
jgi:hypothetical protein